MELKWKEKRRLTKRDADMLISLGKGRAKAGGSLYFAFFKSVVAGGCDRVTYAIEGDRLYLRFAVGTRHYKLHKYGLAWRTCIAVTEAEEQELQKFKGYHKLAFDDELRLHYVEVSD